MKFSEFHQMVQNILVVELPSGESVSNEGSSIAEDIRISRTAFMDKVGANSEMEYKKQCMKDGRIMFHAHIGMSSWSATAEALTLLYGTAKEAGFVVDRAGICLDRRMALPRAYRMKMPAETGPTLESAEDWTQVVGQIVPIQPHMGDFMIGFPASTDVHEHAFMIIHKLLSEAGAETINLGAEINFDQVVLEARTKNVDAILISTHNGMALEYAKHLKDELAKHKVKVPVLMGGILNQKIENQQLPVDVTANLKELGFYPCARLEGRFRKLLEFNIKETVNQK